ncbi:MAG TPA: DUF885 domain-containing protein [Kofleriaceae bacterium]|nr:DUF885 domain-containing protein [Kofleriaceae bacterium]
MDLVPCFGAALGAAILIGACGGSGGAPRGAGGAGGEPPRSRSPLGDTAVAGVADPALRELLADHWDWMMETYPVWATTLGDHRFDDRIHDGSPQAIAADRTRTRDFLARARALPRGSMSPADRLTLDLLVGELEAKVAAEVCDEHLWTVSAGRNPVTDWNTLPERHAIRTPADGANLVARYRQIPDAVDHAIGHLRDGARKGLFAEAEAIRRTLALIDRQLAADLAGWALLEPATAERPGWSATDRERLAADLRAAVEQEIAPAFRRYREAVASEILPGARGAEEAGISHMPNGAACYAARVLEHTGMALDPDELHRIGLDEIARINRDMVALGRELFGDRVPRGDDGALAAILHILRTDRSLYYASAAEVMAGAEEALAAARARIPDFFGRLPRADCVVVPVPDYEAPFTTIAYYREPHFDGSKPGEYFVNTYKPEVRPRFEMQALTFHESIPGHHLQIAIGQEQPALPAFRRFLGSTAFVEGWALYTERLAEEMGLYSGDLDRMGMLSYDAWRAARLVVDTGIHVKGWTRERAEAFMREHTALTEENIRNEVDRYITWPGQALAYKVGQLEILRLRREAQDALGDRFDLKGFHDTVLGSGAVTLPVLQGLVRAWVAERKAG